MKLGIKKLHPGATVPKYQTAGAAGFDLHACLEESVVLNPGDRTIVSTGLSLEIPEGYEGQVRPRSGLAAKNGITVLNSPGTIDCDYRGELKIILINHGSEPFTINHGDRIAQFVVAKYEQAELVEVESLSDSDRSEKGFGSTGV